VNGALAIAVAGDHDDLGVRRERQHLLQRLEPLADAVGIRWQPEILQHHGRLGAAQLADRGLPVAGDEHFVVVEAPLQLLLQPRVVLDDEQWEFLAHDIAPEPTTCAAAGASTAISGNRIAKRVPSPGRLSTRTSPPAARTNSRVW
jgi:hypothetical protein